MGVLIQPLESSMCAECYCDAEQCAVHCFVGTLTWSHH